MALTLYRRHRPECEGGRGEDSRSGEFEEGRRGWKKCACLIHVSGTLGGKFSRKQTGKSDWDEAKAVVAIWEAARSWDNPATIQAPPAPEPAPGRITIARAFHAFTAEYQAHAPNTQKNYRLLLAEMKAFPITAVSLCLTSGGLSTFASSVPRGQSVPKRPRRR